MSGKVLLGAVLHLGGKVSATYEVTVLGEKSVKTKDSLWSSEVSVGADAFIDTCDALTPEIGDVVGVQLYTKYTAPVERGLCIDLIHPDGSHHRVMKPTDSVASGRDNLLSLIAMGL